MFNIENGIIINEYGQGIVDEMSIIELYNKLSLNEKRDYLGEIVALIMQSRVKAEDIPLAIEQSNLKPTFTPCVMLSKGVEGCRLKEIIALPEYELEKVLILLLNLFKIAYQRRFYEERNSPEKWWYWDLSDKRRVALLESQYGIKLKK